MKVSMDEGVRDEGVQGGRQGVEGVGFPKVIAKVRHRLDALEPGDKNEVRWATGLETQVENPGQCRICWTTWT